MRHYLPFEGFHHLLEGVDWDVVQLNKPIVAKLLSRTKIQIYWQDTLCWFVEPRFIYVGNKYFKTKNLQICNIFTCPKTIQNYSPPWWYDLNLHTENIMDYLQMRWEDPTNVYTQIPGEEPNGAIAPGHCIKEVRVGVGGALNHWPIGQHQLVAFANVLEQTVPGEENVSLK